MFKKFCAFLLALPVISALQLNAPTTTVYSSSPLTVTWTTNAGDPTTFDLYLVNNLFRNTFALSNTVRTSDGTISINLPVVPSGSGYALQASPVGNVNSVLSQTTTFDILPPPSNSSSIPSSTSSGTGSPSSVSGSSISTSSGSAINPKTTPLTSTSSSSSSTAVPTGSFNGNSNGALGVIGIGATVVGVLVAAGAFFAF